MEPTEIELKTLDEVLRRARLAAEETGLAGIAAAVVLDDGILAYGENQVHLDNDPTRHAEIVAISRACHSVKRPDLTGATLVSSLQPCEMCLAAMRFAGIGRLLFAARQDNVAAKYFVFPGLRLPDFERAASEGFAARGGVCEHRVLDLYADGQE